MYFGLVFLDATNVALAIWSVYKLDTYGYSVVASVNYSLFTAVHNYVVLSLLDMMLNALKSPEESEAISDTNYSKSIPNTNGTQEFNSGGISTDA